MYQVLSVSESSCLFLQLLPVEMWCCIFRILDPRSLLAGVRAHKSWLNICREDPVLKQKLKSALEEEKRMLRDMLFDPKYQVTISRQKTLETYATNVRKTVCKRSSQFSQPPKELNLDATKISGVKQRRSARRFAPYRI